MQSAERNGYAPGPMECARDSEAAASINGGNQHCGQHYRPLVSRGEDQTVALPSQQHILDPQLFLVSRTTKNVRRIPILR